MSLTLLALVVGVVLLVVAIAVARKSIFIIHEHQLGILERVGKYIGHPLKPGIHTKRPLFDKLVQRLDLRLRNIDMPVDARTQGDGARVRAYVFVEFQVDESKAYEAHYNLADPTSRLRARATEIVQTLLNAMSLEQAMESSKTIGDSIRDELTQYAAGHGYLITNVVVTHVEPEASVLNAMSEQAALARRNEIAETEATATNARRIAEAEAAATVAELSGKASAAQQTALFDAVEAAAKQLGAQGNMAYGDALRYVIKMFEIAATRDAVSASKSSIVTVGSNSNGDLAHAVTAGTIAGQSNE